MTRLKWNKIDEQILRTSNMVCFNNEINMLYAEIYSNMYYYIVCADTFQNIAEGQAKSILDAKKKVKKELKTLGVRFYDEVRIKK